MRSRLVILLSWILIGCNTTGSPPPGSSTTPGATPPSGATVPPSEIGTIPTLAPPPIAVTGVPANVHADSAKATATWIGPAGGSLTATAADGTSYELEIPELAVTDPTAITMTPVTAVDELGLSGGLAGAVFLQPAGLQLAVPATLRIETSSSAPDGMRLVGFDVPDSGAAIDLIPAVRGDDRVSVLVSHFSAPGAAFGTSQDLALIGSSATNTRLAGLLSELLAYDVPWDSLDKVQAGLLIDAVYAIGVRPQIAGSATDQALLDSISVWRSFVFVLNLYAHQGDVDAAIAEGSEYTANARAAHTANNLDGRNLLGSRISGAIDGNRTLCSQSHDLAALANMFFWAGLGDRYDPTSRDWSAAARGCADVAVGVANLATNLRAGAADSLSVTFVFEFSDGTRMPADFEVTLRGGGFTFGSGGANVTYGEAAGTTVTQGVVATQAPPYSLGARACWWLGGIARNVCSTNFSLPFGTGATPPPPTGPVGTAGSADIAAEIAGTYSVRLLCSNSLYGTGQATVTAEGPVVSLIWSVTLSDPGTGGLCHDSLVQGTFPISGRYSGTVVEQPTGAVEIVISSWQVTPCIIPDPPMPKTAGYNRGAQAIGIPVSTCVPGSLFGSMGYNTQRQ